jgi:hypothetical protein
VGADPGQLLHCGLGGVVDRIPGQHQTRRRAADGDHTATIGEKLGGQLHAPDHALDVDGDQSVDRRLIELDEGSGRGDGGVGDQGVPPPPPVDDGLDHGDELAPVADVGGEGGRVSAGGDQLGDHGVGQLGSVGMVDGHPGPGGAEAVDDGPSDPGATTGDQGYGALQRSGRVPAHSNQ